MLLCTLGGLKLQASDFYQTKPLLLLAYLAMEGAKERRHLRNLFWPRGTSPANSLRVALRVLDRNAPGVLESVGPHLITRVQTDVQELLDALDRGTPEQVLTLYQGVFLEGVNLANISPELEEWVYSTREFVAGRVRKAYLSFAESSLLEGRMESARTYAEYSYQRLDTAELEPEEIERLYILLSATGSHLAAKVSHEATEVNLTLTVPAGLAGIKIAGMAEKATAHNLPIRESSFVGRNLELLEVSRLLAQSDCRLLTITGQGGIGKTCLALQAAREELNKQGFGGGVFFVPFATVESPEQIPVHVIEALDLNVQGHENLTSLLVDYIGSRSILLVLDNLEHLLEGTGFITELLEQCINLKVLTTTRERLDLAGEWVLPLEGLAVSGGLADKDVLYQDAVQLFVNRAKRARLGLILGTEDLQDVHELCQLVQGSPLGIELAATWVRTLSCREIVREVSENLDFLSVRTRDMVERHRSVRAVFESSWKLLSTKEQEVLSALSVFRGGFRREAAGEVVGATISVLASLVDKSLLRVLADGRYSRHPLLHQYMKEKLTERPKEKVAIQDKHGAYYLRFLTRRVEVEMFGPRHQHALAAIGEELENVRVAWRWMIAASAPENVQNPMMVTFALQEFHDRRGRFREGIDLFDEAVAGLDGTDTGNHTLLGNALVNRAYLSQRLAWNQEARRSAQRGLELLRPLKEPWGTAIGLYTLGLVAWHTGNAREAEGHIQAALSVTRVLKDNFGRAGTNSLLYALAAVQQALGNYSQAQEYAQAVLELSRGQGNYINVVRSLNTLGNLLATVGKIDEAQVLLQEALQLARMMKFDDLIPQSLVYLAALYHDLGDDSQALTFNRDALLMAQESGDKAIATQALINLAGLAAARHDYVQAQNHLMQALNTTRAKQETPLVLTTLLHLAEVWSEQERLEQAARLANFVLHQRAAEQRQRDRARLLLDALRGQLPAETMNAALACCKTMKLDEVVTEVLARFQGSTPSKN